MKVFYLFILFHIVDAKDEQNCTGTGIISKIKTLPNKTFELYFNQFTNKNNTAIFYCPRPIGFHCFHFMKTRIPSSCLPINNRKSNLIVKKNLRTCEKNGDCGDDGFCQKFISYDIDPNNNNQFTLKLHNISFCYENPHVNDTLTTKLQIDKEKVGLSLCNESSDCKPGKFGSFCNKTRKYSDFQEGKQKLFDGLCVENICGGNHDYNETYQAVFGLKDCSKCGKKVGRDRTNLQMYESKCIEGICCFRKIMECTRGEIINPNIRCDSNSKPTPLLLCNNETKGANWCDLNTHQCCQDPKIGQCPYGDIEKRSFRYFQPKCKSNKDCKDGLFCADDGYCCENVEYPETEGPPISFYLVPAVMIAFIVGGLAFLIFYKFEEIEDY